MTDNKTCKRKGCYNPVSNLAPACKRCHQYYCDYHFYYTVGMDHWCDSRVELQKKQEKWMKETYG